MKDPAGSMMNGESVHRSEKRFRELFRNVSDCIAVYEAVDGGRDFVTPGNFSAVVLFLDISDLIKAREALKESEHKYCPPRSSNGSPRRSRRNCQNPRPKGSAA
jgi:hypothetical protein